MTFSTPEAETLFNKYKMIYGGKKLDLNRIRINWKMTDWCNYKCPYCIQGVNTHQTKMESQEYLEEIAHKIRPQLTHKNISLTLMGGEASFFDLESIVKILFEKNDCEGKVNLITNLSNKAEYYVNFCNLNLGKVHPVVQPSYQWTDIDVYLEKCKLLKVADVHEVFSVTCVVDDTKSLEDVEEVQRKFDEADIPIRWTLGRVPGTGHTEFFLFQDGVKDFVLSKNKELKEELGTSKVAITAEYMDGSVKHFVNKGDVLNEVCEVLGKKNGARFENFICKTGISIHPNGNVKAGLCPERNQINLGNILTDDVKIKIYSERCSGKTACNACSNILVWNGKL